MRLYLRYIFVFILQCCFFCAVAQDYNAVWSALRDKSDAAMEQHNFPLYLKLAHEEYNLTASHKDTALMIRACIKLVDYYTNIRLNNDSANYYRNKGLYWSRLNKDIESETDFRYMQAAQYVADGKLVEAYALFQRLDSIVTRNNFDFAPFFNDAYAKLLVGINEYPKAVERFKIVAADNKKQEMYQDLAVAYVNIATVYGKLKQRDSTFVYLNKALLLNQNQKDTTGIAECYTRFGILYKKEGQLGMALRYYKLAFDLNPVNPSNTLISNYTDVLISEGKFKEAERLLENLRKEERISTQLVAIASLIRLKEAEGAYKEALTLSEEYNEKNQELLDVEKMKQIEELETQYEVADKESQINILHERTEHQSKILSRNRTILFVSVGLLLSVLLVVFLLYRNRSIRLKAEQIQLEQQLLRTQMNPHFIFNCLTNIQATVLQKEYLKAAGYIATFSKLVRNILESSTQGKVTFAKELATLRDYLIMQKIRYNDRFDYDIVVDSDIEEDMTYIPPMLFQPIVENAIEHGIADKTDGFIEIAFTQHGHYIRCAVMDNGIGYGNNKNASAPVKEKTSLSTHITKRRLAILSKPAKKSLDYSITVLRNEKNEITGTKVEIDIPILNT